MTPSAALALSLFALAIPEPPPAPPFAGLGAGPAPAPPVEVVDADGKVLGPLVSLGSGNPGGAQLFFAAAGHIFAMSQDNMMSPDGTVQTHYANTYQVYWATPDCSGQPYGYTMTWGTYPLGFVAATALFPDGWHVVRQSPTRATFYSGSYLDVWSGADPSCVTFAYEWPWDLNALEDLGPAPSFRSPLRPRVNVP